ncbi:MAG: hypothetical protein ACKO2V_16355 [Snowella sp.]
MNQKKVYLSCLIASSLLLIASQKSLALPPADDIPEEVLRTEIILEARSPIDGRPLTASEYAQLQEEKAKSPYPPQINSKIRNLVFLLQIRKFVKTIFPFL